MTFDPLFETYTLSPRSPGPPRLSPGRTVAIAISLCLHLAVLGWLLFRAIEPMPVTTQPPLSARPGLQLVLLDAAPVLSAPPPAPAAAAQANRSVLSQAPPARWRVRPVAPAVAAPTESAAPVPATVGAARLFDSITAAAGVGAPTAPHQSEQSGPALPGRDQAFIDVPIRFRSKPSPQQIVLAVASFLNAGGAVAGGRFNDVRDGSDPLRRFTDERMQDAVDPVCNDPEHPRIDDRCLK